MGEQKGVRLRYFRGGKEYEHQCRKIQERIEISEKKMRLNMEEKHSVGNESGIREQSYSQPYNQKYWMKLKHLSEYYAHLVSRQIVDYCVEMEAGILELPEYEKEHSAYVMLAAGNWSPLHLSNRIRKLISYKTWKAGIMVLDLRSVGCGSVCGLRSCGEKEGWGVCV